MHSATIKKVIILFLHVSTLLCLPQGALSTLLSYINMSIQSLVIQFKISHLLY